VHVLDRLGDVALAQPLDAEAARAEPGDRLAGERAEADAPVVVAVGADRREPAGVRAARELRLARALAEPADDEPDGDEGRDDRRRGAQARRRSSRAGRRSTPQAVSAPARTKTASAISPSRSRAPIEPSSEATPGRTAATAPATSPPARTTAAARSWARWGAKATRTIRPRATDVSAPRENEM